MARINLLPWREELRRARQRQFLMSLLFFAVAGVIVVFLAATVYEQKIGHQQTRNNLIRAEIRKLETRIKEIDELERTRARLLSRKQVIEQLQASRSMTVELLDKLAKTIPVGITLGSVGQQGQSITLIGSSQSNARVSAYLQSLEKSDLFLKPELGYVRIATRTGSATEPYEFSIKAKLRPPKSADEEDGFDESLDDESPVVRGSK